METLDILDNLEHLRNASIVRVVKSYKTRKNPFLIYNDIEFRKKYRFNKENAKKIIQMVRYDLKGKK